MNTSIIYHNPRCSKCRAALALLHQRGIQPRLIEYLEKPPSKGELADLLQTLGFADARQLMRNGEADYRELGLDAPGLSQEFLLATLAEHPQLIERPIFVHQGRAVIGRPPEKVLEIL
jgi:arsenate reductase